MLIGIDIGGSLCKIAVQGGVESEWSRAWTAVGDESHIIVRTIPASKKYVEGLIRAIQRASHGKVIKVAITGGGVHRHSEIIKQLKHSKNINLCTRTDEFTALVGGLRYVRRNFPSGCLYHLSNFLFHGNVGPDRAKVTASGIDLPPDTPVLVVNMGTGTSFVDVPGDSNFNRVGGSSLGGGTFMGLVKGLTNCKGYEQALELAALGDSRKVDMLVGDIYGDSQIRKVGLRSSTLASSFARLADTESDACDSDKALSCLIMISMNVASMAQLHARLHSRKYILFTGTFLYENSIALRIIAYAINFWSGGKRTALFVEHSAYLGCIGALGSLELGNHGHAKL